MLKGHSVDPEIENNQESWTPYSFCYDNAVKFTDTNGRPGGIPINPEAQWKSFRQFATNAGLQMEGKVGFGATVGIEFHALGAKFALAYDGGTNSTGYNSKDGIINERTAGKEASMSFLKHEVKAGSSTTTAYNLKGSGLPDGRTPEGTISKIDKTSAASGRLSRETSVQTTYKAIAGPDAAKGYSLRPSSDALRRLWQDRDAVQVGKQPIGPPVVGTETSVSWVGLSVKAGFYVGFNIKSVFPDSTPEKQ